MKHDRSKTNLGELLSGSNQTLIIRTSIDDHDLGDLNS